MLRDYLPAQLAIPNGIQLVASNCVKEEPSKTVHGVRIEVALGDIRIQLGKHYVYVKDPDDVVWFAQELDLLKERKVFNYSFRMIQEEIKVTDRDPFIVGGQLICTSPCTTTDQEWVDGFRVVISSGLMKIRVGHTFFFFDTDDDVDFVIRVLRECASLVRRLRESKETTRRNLAQKAQEFQQRI